MGKNHNGKEDKAKPKNHPFNNDIQNCCDCGDCCLIHQQFTLEQNVDFDEETTVTVFEAVGFEPACTPGQPSVDPVTTQQSSLALLIVSNIGENSFQINAVGPDNDIDFTTTVFPGAQVAFSGVIRRVDAIFPPQPVRALFHFDLFLLPPGPV